MEASFFEVFLFFGLCRDRFEYECKLSLNLCDVKVVCDTGKDHGLYETYDVNLFMEDAAYHECYLFVMFELRLCRLWYRFPETIGVKLL